MNNAKEVVFALIVAVVVIVAICVMPFYYTNKGNSHKPYITELDGKQVVCEYKTEIREYRGRDKNYEEWQCLPFNELEKSDG